MVTRPEIVTHAETLYTAAAFEQSHIDSNEDVMNAILVKHPRFMDQMEISYPIHQGGGENGNGGSVETQVASATGDQTERIGAKEIICVLSGRGLTGTDSEKKTYCTIYHLSEDHDDPNVPFAQVNETEVNKFGLLHAKGVSKNDGTDGPIMVNLKVLVKDGLGHLVAHQHFEFTPAPEFLFINPGNEERKTKITQKNPNGTTKGVVGKLMFQKWLPDTEAEYQILVDKLRNWYGVVNVLKMWYPRGHPFRVQTERALGRIEAEVDGGGDE